MTLMHQAAATGNLLALDQQYERRFLDTQDPQGNTPLLLACRAGSASCITFLLNRGANCQREYLLVTAHSADEAAMRALLRGTYTNANSGLTQCAYSPHLHREKP